MTDTIPLAAARMGPVIGGGYPGKGIMAGIAGSPCEQPGMESRVGMADGTGGRKTRKDPIQMTTGAGQTGMTTSQWEITVIESSRQPAIWVMTGVADSTELRVVPVVPGVAGVTIGWSAFEISIDMAAGAGHTGMFSDQLKA